MTLDELLDREAIRDCLARYCRGVDRLDRALLLSTYWPGAEDDHGSAPLSVTAEGGCRSRRPSRSDLLR